MMMGRWERTAAGALGLLLGVNGLFMLAAPFVWYEAVPGVVQTGPYNSHFVRDIGAVYLTVALALAAFGWRPQKATSGLLAAAAFLVLHAAVHVFDTVCGRTSLADLARDLPGVFLPAILAAGLGLRALVPGRSS